MNGYFLVILLIWMLIILTSKIFSLKITDKGTRIYQLIALVTFFVIPGFLVDWLAVNLQWYIFPIASNYLWVTPIGVPVEEILFFITVPIWIIVLWKLSQKLVS